MKGFITSAKLFSFLALGYVVFTFTSCQKEFTGDIVVETDSLSVSNRVKTYTESVTTPSGNQVDTFNLTYDSQDRIISMVSIVDPGNKFLYTYNTDNTFTVDLYVANTLNIHGLFYLNSLSLVDSAVQSNDTKDTTTEKFLYNSSKQLVTSKEYEYSQSTGPVLFNTVNYTYDNKGNVATEFDGSSTITYEYYPDLVNNITLGQVFYTHNMNLRKTSTYTSGGTTVVLNHTYTFDTKNRVTSEKGTVNNVEVSKKTYTYIIREESEVAVVGSRELVVNRELVVEIVGSRELVVNRKFGVER